jgi:hypothetical protein
MAGKEERIKFANSELVGKGNLDVVGARSRVSPR